MSIKEGYTFQTRACGKAKVVKIDHNNVTIRFGDGTEVISNPSNLYNGSIKNPNHKSNMLVGKRFETNNHGYIKIVEYVSAAKVLIEFESDGTQKWTQLVAVRAGKVKNNNAPDPKALIVGKRFETNNHGFVTVVSYLNSSSVDVIFDDGTLVTTTSQCLREGRIGNPSNASNFGNNLLGKVFDSNSCGKFKIIKYVNKNNVTIKFKDGTRLSVRLGNIKSGNVCNPNYPSVCGVGYIGIGKYNSVSHNRIHSIWTHMLQRCYDEKRQNLQPSYIGCTVHKDWHNFQNFCADYLNMYGSDLNWELDKDMLRKGNKIYSPKTCILLPKSLNTILGLNTAARGEYPIGVHYSCTRKCYVAQCLGTSSTIIGDYASVEEAFYAYKSTKESVIKKRAKKYKSQLDPRAYKALMAYEVEIDD